MFAAGHIAELIGSATHADTGLGTDTAEKRFTGPCTIHADD